MKKLLSLVLLELMLGLVVSPALASAKEITLPLTELIRDLKFAMEEREKAVVPIPAKGYTPLARSYGKYAIIHYVPDDDYNYYHTNYVSGILGNKGYSVITWNAGRNKCSDSACTNYFKQGLNRNIRVIYYYGHTAGNKKKGIWGLILDDMYGVKPDTYAGNFKAMGANLNEALVFVLGCDSYKLRYGIKKHYSVTYVGTKDLIALKYIEPKGKKFWSELSKGKTVKQAVDAIQLHWWEWGCPRFGLDGNKSWKL